MRTFKTSRFALVLSLCLTAAFGTASADESKAPKWEHVDEDDGINTWKLEIPGQVLPGFRGQAFIKGTVDDVMKQLLDYKSHTKWMFHCEESDMLNEEGKDHFIMYNRTDAGVPFVSDRDVVLDTLIQRAPDAKAAVVKFNNISSKLKGAIDGVIRMPRLVGFYKMWQVEPNKVKVLYQVEADIGGSIPAWLAARATKELPYETLSKLRKRVEAK